MWCLSWCRWQQRSRTSLNWLGRANVTLLKQLNDIKSGARPIVEMTGLLDNMSDQDLQDISAYFASQKMSVGAADPKLVKRGGELFRGGKLAEGMPACIGCHGPNGAGLDAAGYPNWVASTRLHRQAAD